MMAEHHTPFLGQSQFNAEHDPQLDPVPEDVSDGLQVFRRASSWFLPTYTRRDCRCGMCSIGDTEPCPYARSHEAHTTTMTSMLTAGARSLTRLLSVSPSGRVSLKDT